ncbi:MAG: hypothetical protein R2744_08360 [Bacteroidales bacterium]
MVCEPNTTITSNIYTYYRHLQDRYNGEAHTYNASFLKLKESGLNTIFTQDLCVKTKVLQGASDIAFFATNLFSLDKWPQFDPEGGMMTETNVFNGIESGAFPMTRTKGINVRLSF